MGLEDDGALSRPGQWHLQGWSGGRQWRRRWAPAALGAGETSTTPTPLLFSAEIISMSSVVMEAWRVRL